MADKLTAEELSKDKFFMQLSTISAKMIEEHGKDFATGALIMAAQWIAQGKAGAQNQTEH
jgi:hypothetical protein